MSAPNPMDELQRRAALLVQQGRFRTIQEALRALQVGGPQQAPPTRLAQPDSRLGPIVRGQDPGGTPISGFAPIPPGGDPRQGPAPSTNTAPPGTPGTKGGPSGPGRGPGSTPPGYYRAPDPSGQDKYGGAMRGNTNAQGVQSNGDDDPWLIGAAQGTTYDPMVLMRWYDRAMKGDGEAAWVLRQVGFLDEQNRPVFNSKDGLEQWANSRKLDRRASEGSATPWYHDPKNWGADQGFGGESDAMAAFDAAPWYQTARDGDGPSQWRPQRGAPAGDDPRLPQGRPAQDPSPRTVPAPMQDRGPVGYGAPGAIPDPKTNAPVDLGGGGYGQPPQLPGGRYPQSGGWQSGGGPDPIYPQEIRPDGSTGHRAEPLPARPQKTDDWGDVPHMSGSLFDEIKSWYR
jgi:hypothetical protein